MELGAVLSSRLKVIIDMFFKRKTIRQETAGIRSRVKMHALRLLLVCFGYAVAMAFLELSLWVIDQQKPRNTHPYWTWGHQVRSNFLGFRARDFKIPKPDSTFRILVLGDSCTWGQGVAEADRYTDLMEDELRLLVTDWEVEVVNCAICGWSTVKQCDFLKRNIDRLQPNLIVVGFCINDPQTKGQDYASELNNFEMIFRGMKNLRLFGLTRSANFLDRHFDQSLRYIGLVPQWWDALDRTYDVQSREWQQFTAALSDIRKLSNGYMLPRPLFVPLLQGNGDFNEPDSILALYLKWYRQASDLAEQLGFQVVDMEAPFKQQGYMNRSVNEWDDHPSTTCHEIYAKTIVPRIYEVFDRVGQQRVHNNHTSVGLSVGQGRLSYAESARGSTSTRSNRPE